MSRIAIIQGVNINQIGSREREIYGSTDIFDFQKKLEEEFEGILHFYYSNIEGDLVNFILSEKAVGGSIIINPGAYTHSSIAIADALRQVKAKKVEVHISQVFAREPYRKRSVVSESCDVSISGMGLAGYRHAILYLLNLD